MADTTEPRLPTGRNGISRRRLLRASGGVAVASVPAVSGLASGQSSGEDGDDDVTTKGVLATTTPKFGKNDYLGLFLRITGTKNDPETKGVGSCEFIGATDRIAAFTATISEKGGHSSSAQQTTLYTAPKDSTVQEGKVYVVNDQTSCSAGGYVTVTLEEVGESSIETTGAGGTTGGGETETPTKVQTGTTGGGEAETTGGEETETTTPGFSVLTAVAGIGAAALAAVRWGTSDE